MRHTLEYGLEGNSKPKISEILGALFAKMRCLIEKVRVSLSLVGYVWLFLLQFLRFDDLPKPLLFSFTAMIVSFAFQNRNNDNIFFQVIGFEG